MLLLMLASCNFQDILDDATTTFEGLTNPLVVQGWYVGVAEPESDQIDLSGTDFDKGAALTVFLADAGNANELDKAPVSGAGVQADGVDLSEESDGAYAASSDDGLTYTEGGDSLVSVQIGDGMAEATVLTPAAADANIPTTGALGANLTVDLSGQGFDNVLVVVLDMASAEVVWTNTPSDIKGVYDFATADQVNSLTVPGAEAFAGSGVYAVGVAGMNKADSDSFVDMNTALSSVMAGKLRFYPYVIP